MRMTDLDSKDINIRNSNGEKYHLTNLIKEIVKNHLRWSDFSDYVDKARGTLLKHGSCITKYCRGKLHDINLSNIILQPGLSNIQDGYIIEKNKITYSEYKDNIKDFKENWRKEGRIKQNTEVMEKAFTKAQKDGNGFLFMYEFWTNEIKDGEQHKICKKYKTNIWL
jgi:hypothetical protein